MKTVTWEYKKEITTDYYFLWWFQMSRHSRKQRIFGWEFHWKGGDVWYKNFKRHAPKKGIIAVTHVDGKKAKEPWNVIAEGVFSRTRLTLRLGRRFLIIGTPNKAAYYRDVKILSIRTWGILHDKVIEPHVGQIMIKHNEEEIQGSVAEMKRKMINGMVWLDKDYPSGTWRN